MSRIDALRGNRWFSIAMAIVVLVGAILLPFAFNPLDSFIQNCILAMAYVVMALGLNIVVGFAGLLDLGYVAFYAFGSYAVGWFASDFFSSVNGEKGIHFLVGDFAGSLPGIHLNFFLVMIIAVAVCALVGTLIGLPTLRLRGDYIAIVTLAFGEIIRVFAFFGNDLPLGLPKITNGRQAIAPVDQIDLFGLKEFDSAFSLRPYYYFVLGMIIFVLFVNFRLRDSRLGRAWIAIREDEVAAASMGVPLVKTKLLAYATGGALGGLAGAFLGTFLQSINANQFQFGFSIFILAMIILGGLGSIWGVVVGAISLSFINTYLIPELNGVPDKVGLDFDLTQLSFGIFGFLIVLMMVLRPEGLIPERRRKMELTEGVGTGDEQLVEVRG
ncbi:MAG: branched-chain amino acid ABC transporter permease [Solirubrobacteraceae bacterium]